MARGFPDTAHVSLSSTRAAAWVGSLHEAASHPLAIRPLAVRPLGTGSHRARLSHGMAVDSQKFYTDRKGETHGVFVLRSGAHRLMTEGCTQTRPQDSPEPAPCDRTDAATLPPGGSQIPGETQQGRAQQCLPLSFLLFSKRCVSCMSGFGLSLFPMLL